MRKVYNHKPRGVTLDGIKSDDNGQLVTSPSYFYTDTLNAIQETTRYAIENLAVNIFDEKIENNIKLFGGKYWVGEDYVNNVHKDDYVEFSIIDKDDILGFFSMFGLDKDNGDILELNKFVINDIVKKGNSANDFYSDLTIPSGPASPVIARWSMRAPPN